MLKKLLYENTFNQIFTQHYTRLYLYAYHLTNDAEASRDIVSDVFAKLWEDIKHIKQENVSGYLTTTVRNRCIDHFRHQQVEIQYTKEYFAEVDTFYTDYTEAMRQDILISKMLDKLPAMTRHILEECYLARKIVSGNSFSFELFGPERTWNNHMHPSNTAAVIALLTIISCLVDRRCCFCLKRFNSASTSGCFVFVKRK